jgi:hypothetical protein
MKKTTLFFCIGFVLTCISCRLVPFDDIVNDNTQQWAIPIVDTKRSVNDLVKGFDKQAFLQVNPDGLLNLHYTGNFVAQNTSQILKDLQNALFPLTDTVMGVPLQTNNNVDIETIDVKSGTMIWYFSSPDDVLNVTLTIPQLTKNGVAFKKTFLASRLPYIDSIKLAGWRYTPQNDTIFIIHDARRLNTNERVNLKGRSGIQIQNFQFSLLKGYLGMETFDAPQDTIEMDFIKGLNQGEIRFEEPKMTMTLDNAFGVPVKAVAKVAQVISVDGSVLPLKSALTDGKIINYPKLNEIGQSKRTVEVLDKTNSNLVDIISSKPTAIIYDIDGVTNPDAGQRTVGFMTDSSFFKLQVEFDLPIHGAAKNFFFRDTFDFDLKKYTTLTNAELRVLTENGLPLDVNLQGYFVAANGTVIDSFYNKTTPLVLKSAPINALGVPTGKTKQESSVVLDADKLKKILPATKLHIKYGFSTTNNGTVPVKLYNNQDVKVQIGLKFGLK